MNPNIILVVETFIAFIIAVTIHEAAHAAMASALGDSTPVAEGRLSLVPARQMAAIGTIVAIVASFGSFAGGLGWGRPVNFDARRMRGNPNVSMILVALAGPVVNLIFGLVLAVIVSILPGYSSLPLYLASCGGREGAGLQSCLSIAQPAGVLRLDQFLIALAATSIVLAIVNIIPLHPLDGYKILYALLPSPQAISFRRFEPYMELTLLIIFFVVPYVLAFINIPFHPIDMFVTAANVIVNGIAPNVIAFYTYL